MEKTVQLRSSSEARALFGSNDGNLKALESALGIRTVCRNEQLVLSGPRDNVKNAAGIIGDFLNIIRKGQHINKEDFAFAVESMKARKGENPPELPRDRIEVPSKRRFIVPRTPGQKAYVDAIREYDIVFAIGPAGTGKTYLAMAMAVSALKNQEVSRIILTRPAVEAGESLGFLPGDLYDKVTPYLRPLYDALYDMMEPERIKNSIERGIIEVAPLAYMRGRTLNDSFVILDEAQNSTSEQMRMFLTRLGFDSKTVITGDITQIDLPAGRTSGLVETQTVLSHIEGMKFIYFTGRDVVRHELVQEIIKAYAELDSNKKNAKND